MLTQLIYNIPNKITIYDTQTTYYVAKNDYAFTKFMLFRQMIDSHMEVLSLERRCTFALNKFS